MKILRLLLSFAILTSLVIVLWSALVGADVCYTCDPVSLAALTFLHLFLLVAALCGGQMTFVLVGTLLIFFVTRISTLQFFPDHYVYQRFPLTVSDMRSTICLLLLLSVALIFGSVAGGTMAVPGKNAKTLTIVPFQSKILHLTAFYRKVCYFVIFAKTLALLLFVSTGAGLPIANNNFPIAALRTLKLLNFFSFLGLIPFIWLVVMKPQGYERRLTWTAIGLQIAALMTSLSKTSLIYSVIPFFLVYFVAAKRMSARMLAICSGAVVVSLVGASLFLSSLRIWLAAKIAGESAKFGASGGEFSVGAAVLGFMDRVWSSFDVLGTVVKNYDLLAQYRNLSGELTDFLNSYVRFSDIAGPQWSQLLPHLMHGTSYQTLLISRTGENLGVLQHLFLYAGLWGAALMAFLMMFVCGFIYRSTSSIFVRILVLQFIFFGISNGSGIFELLNLPQPILLLWILILVTFSHKKFRLMRTQSPATV